LNIDSINCRHVSLTPHYLLGLRIICRGCRVDAYVIKPPMSGRVPRVLEGHHCLAGGLNVGIGLLAERPCRSVGGLGD
jgi:hypothetical protein